MFGQFGFKSLPHSVTQPHTALFLTSSVFSPAFGGTGKSNNIGVINKKLTIRLMTRCYDYI